MKRSKSRVMLYILLCFALIFSNTIPLFAQCQISISISPQNINNEGSKSADSEYVISVLTEDKWQEAGRLGFDMFLREKNLDLSDILPESCSAYIRITQDGGGTAYLDSVFLGGETPQSANFNDGILLLKLSKKDLDLTNVTSEGVELVFPANRNSNIVSITGRIEEEKISEKPFRFPSSNAYTNINEYSEFYTYKLNYTGKKLSVDGNTEEIEGVGPIFKEYCISSPGHPEGYVYGWVMNDQGYLYVLMDVTPDNTMDFDKVYAKIYVKKNNTVKEFKVSSTDTTWGEAAFTYTDKVDYQHTLYEFKIPLMEIGNSEADTLKIIFEGYGI